MRMPELIGIRHHAWGIVRLNLNSTASGSPSAPSSQVLPRWNSVTCHHMAQSDVCLIIEQALIRTLRLATLRLRLTVVVEVIMQQRCLIALFRKELLYLLVLTH